MAGARGGVLRGLRRRVLPHWTDHWPEILASVENGVVLHLGAGHSPLAGAVTADINPATSPHVICDLNEAPWPFADDSFDGLVALSVLEHLDDFLLAMGQIHRISRAGAVTNILVPHFSDAAAFVDPTHRRVFSVRSCDYFIRGTEIEGEYGFYVPYRFALVASRVHLRGGLRYLPGAEWLACRYPAFWENYLCQLFRGGGIFWQLRALK